MFGPNTADKAALLVVAKIWNIKRQHSQHNLVTVLLLALEKVLLKYTVNDKDKNEIGL